jgi:hypothetical protein
MVRFFVISGIQEEVCKGFGASRIDGIVLSADFIDNRDGELLDPLFNVRQVRRRNGIRILYAGLVEVTVNNDRRECDASSDDGIFIS